MATPLVALRNAAGVPILAWGPDELRVQIVRNGAQSLGFDVVVLTAKGIEDPGRRLEAAGVRTVIRCPYLDNRNLEQAKRRVLECAPAAAALIRQGHRVLVLCAAGENRSAIMTARIRYMLTGQAGADIVASMRSQPRERGVTFSNGVFRGWASSWPAFDAATATPPRKFSWLIPAGIAAAAVALFVATVGIRGHKPAAATANKRRRRARRYARAAA